MIVGLLALTAGLAGFCVLYGPELLAFVADAPRFRAWVEERGLWGRAAFVGMMAVQIIAAMIPGEPLEIAAGYAFGTVEGTALCLLGALGAWAGGAPLMRATLRVVAGGVFALAVTAAIGKLFGIAGV